MKGELRMKILEAVADGAVNIADSFAAFLSAGYGASASKIDFKLRAIQRRRTAAQWRDNRDRTARLRFAQMMYFLKKDGLIEKDGRGENTVLQSTRKGMSLLRKLKGQFRNRLPEKHYEKIPSENFIIVAFDVPEKERRKRDWLREALGHIGLQRIQQSLWMGKKTIPKNFLEDIERLGIASYIEIFEIKKSGTLRHIV